mgnify:CR=1 FL=1
MQKKIIICVAVVVLLLLGVFTAYFYYDNKYVGFQDKIMKAQVLEALDSQKDKVLKTEAEDSNSVAKKSKKILNILLQTHKSPKKTFGFVLFVINLCY